MQNRQSNNLNAIRLLLAIMVILAHSFPLTYGGERNGDPLFLLSHEQTNVGWVAVDLFFFISGLLITASWLNCRSMNDYMRRRVLRIFPGYVVALIFSFVIALIFSAQPFSHCASRFGAVIKDIFSLGFDSCNGDWIFANNPHPNISNGSLWTISREFTCYLLVAGIGLFGFFKHRFLILVLFLAMFGYYALMLLKGQPSMLVDRRFFSLFLAGTAAWLWRDKIPLHFAFAVIALIIALVATQFSPWFIILTPIALAYLVLWFGYARPLKMFAWCNQTDLSYGVYLYAFPIQQMLVTLGIKNPWLLFAAATALSFVAAFASWHWVEKVFLAMKSKDFSDCDCAAKTI